ncbi:MAG TPA: hypothetical protein VHQ65_08905 [Thermoanaerobaculia bacterium]|nr:hypothetical protein [Thermoanaerobaculia bacterium]
MTQQNLEAGVRGRAIPAVLLAVALLAAAPPATAQAPDGLPFGHFTQLGGGNAGSGVMPIVGWALDDDGVESVDILVDGRLAGRAIYNQSRPDVELAHPGYPAGSNAGFGFLLDTTRYLNGLHVVNALITAENGERSFIRPLVFEFLNTSHNLKPFGEIERPAAHTELYGTCDPANPQRRLTVISGHALDVGTEIGDLGVGYVELMVDGSLLFNSRTDCTYLPTFGGLTQCYGLRRLDIERAYPLLTDSPHAGFRFLLDVGDLIGFGYAEGHHVLSVRVGDVAGQVAEIDEVPVTFVCQDAVGNEGSYGDADLPHGNLFFGGLVAITGWAVDFEGIERVEIHVDGTFRGTAVYGLPRPGVASEYPGFPNAPLFGWSFGLDTTQLSDGFHHLQVLAIDEEGFTTLVGERLFLVENAPLD